MKNIRLASLLAGLIMASSFARTASAACGISAVCSDVSTTLTGQVNTEGFTLHWTTDDESGVASYQVYRIVGTTRTLLATVTPVASCGSSHEYGVTDANMADSWAVEVWAPSGSFAACLSSVINGSIGG